MTAGSTRELPEDDRAPPAARADGDLPRGTMIGRFVVRGRIGAGGMGVVLAADDPDLGRAVAVKLVRAGEDRPGLRARLLREAQAMALVDHPHVVRVYEVGERGADLYIAMELIDGETLTSWLAAPRTWQEILEVFRQAGLGLAAIHDAGMVHRDVKPDNVLVDRGGRARVADLGLVRAMAPEVTPAMAASLTRTGIAMGTPGFMAPEQQRGERVDARADQYSFCRGLEDALRGRGAPRPVVAAVERGLAVDPAARFPSMHALLAALAPRRSRRTRLVATAAFVAVGALAATVLLIRPSTDARSPSLALSPGEPAAPPSVDAAPATDASPVADAAPAAGAARTEVSLAPRRPAARARPAELVAAPGVTGSHREALRAAIRDLNYRGFDLATFDATLDRTEASFEDDLARRLAAGETATTGILVDRVMLGHVARRRGDCGTAIARYTDALATRVDIRPGHAQQETNFLWRGRAHFGRALCVLDAGDLSGPVKDLERANMIGWGQGGQTQLTEIALVWGIRSFSMGDRQAAFLRLQNIHVRGDERTDRALDAWLHAVGWSLR